jgi:hypothetical protein
MKWWNLNVKTEILRSLLFFVWVIILLEEERLRVFEKMMLRQTYGSERQWAELHSDY